MSHASATSIMTCAYPDHEIRKRMDRVAKKRPSLTLSRQLVEAIELHLPALEEKAGLKKFTKAT